MFGSWGNKLPQKEKGEGLSALKKFACNAEDNPWLWNIPWRRKWQPTQVLLPGKSHGWRSMVGYTSWGRKESDMTERLHFHFQNTRYK